MLGRIIWKDLFDGIAGLCDGPQWLHIAQRRTPSFPEFITMSGAAIANPRAVSYGPPVLDIGATALDDVRDRGVCRTASSLLLSARPVFGNFPIHTTIETS